MSLVNDLLIELDRQNASDEDAKAAYTRGLNPRKRRRARRSSRLVNVAAIAACLLFLAAGLSQIVAIPEAATPPAVAARPVLADAPAVPVADTIEIAPEAPALGALPDEAESLPVAAAITRIDRPAAVHRVSIEKTERFARLRIEADPGLVHRLQRDDALRHLELVFERSSLPGALEPVELVGTPIRALSTERRGEDLHLLLGLDPGTRIQSQSLETAEGTTIFVDFQRRSPPRPEATAALGAADATSERIDTPTAEGVAPSVEIGPSDAELERRTLEVARSASRAAVDTAREAEAEGDLAQASRSYRQALEHDPANRDALIEWATLLSKRGRSDDAIELVRRARRNAPDDPRLTMLQARLVESAGRIEDAIVLLDRSSASLTETPEVHALTAALLQRAGRHAEAIDRYEAIVRRYPGESRWWLGLGISLDAVDRGEEALDVYRIAMQIGTLSHPSRRWVSTRIEALGEDREG